MRPDEQATESIIQRQKQSDQRLKSGIKTAGSIALTAAGAAGISRILPFLNQYIPEELALKGISKISPKLGNILNKGMQQGLSIKSGLDFLKENFSPNNKQEPEQTSQESTPDNKNPIQKYSPNLFTYVKGLIQNGSSPAEAASKAKKFLDKKDQDIIKKMETDYKTDWLNIVESIFGKGDVVKGNENQQQMQQQAPQQQSGFDDQGLIQALENILKM